MKSVPFIPDNAPFSSQQRLWLNGFLAGLFASASADQAEAPAAAKPAVPLTILFGSQTGTAEGLARRIAKQSGARGCQPRVIDAATHASVDWKSETNLLVVTSTYGDGDMPDNAQEFWDWLQTDAASVLSHLNYAVLALGDTNYSEFCAAGKKIDERLAQIGAKRIHDRTDCDVDYEAPANAWIDGVFGKLVSHATPAEDAKDITAETLRPLQASGGVYSKTNPFSARLITNRKLTGEGSGKETRHFEISLEGSGLNYESGDALGVYPSNCPALVDDLLRALGCDGEEAVAIPNGGELSLRKALTDCFDITKPGAELLQKVAEKNAMIRELLAPERKADLKKWLWGREVIDLLHEIPEARFAPAEFVTLLKKMAPRLYSISSSPKAHAGQVHLTVGIVRHDSHGRARKGVCSTFLAERVDEQTMVPVFIQTSHGFRLPVNGD